MCKSCVSCFRLTPFHQIVLGLSEMALTTKLKVSFTLDLDKLNYARELQGLPELSLHELQDALAKEASVRFHIAGEIAWYNDPREIRWHVI